MEDTYTKEQESWIDEQYEKLGKAVVMEQWIEASVIIGKVKVRDFEKVAADMEQFVSKYKPL